LHVKLRSFHSASLFVKTEESSSVAASATLQDFKHIATDYYPQLHLNQEYTQSWLENVLGRDRSKWEALVNNNNRSVPQRPSCKNCGLELDLGPPGMLSSMMKTKQNKHNWENLLTRALCKESFGYGGKSCLQTCRFQNLYMYNKDKQKSNRGSLIAHILEGSDNDYHDEKTKNITGSSNNSYYFPTRRVERIRTMSIGLGLGGQRSVVIRKHKNLEAFRDTILSEIIGDDSASPATNSTVLNETAIMDTLLHNRDEEFTVAMVPRWHANQGHALYDYLYPAFLELVNWDLGYYDFSVFVQLVNHMRAYADLQDMILAQIRHERLYGIFGGLGVKGGGWTTTNKDNDYPQIFGDMFVGIGANIDEVDANINYTHPGGVSSLDAVRKFRDRLMHKFDILVKPRPIPSPTTVLQAIVIQSRTHHSIAEGAFQEAAMESARYGVDLKFVYWPDIGFDKEEVQIGQLVDYQEGLGRGATPAAFAAQLRLLAKTDIHISGPGTSMMYQQLLRDGSVHVNLGNKIIKNSVPTAYMDEFMAEGSPHIRCLYAHFAEEDYRPATEYGLAIGRLAGIAARLVREGFDIPVQRGINLSPTSTLLKAYGHLRYGRGLDPLTPFWGYTGDEGLQKNTFSNFEWMAGVTNASTTQYSDVDDLCLLSALGQDYNYGDPMNLGWFSRKNGTWNCLNASSVHHSSHG